MITELPKEFINADPTPNQKYLKWIVESYLDSGIRRFEDMSRARMALLEYGYLLGEKLVINKFEQNIYAFCGLAGCTLRKGPKPGLDSFLDKYTDALKEYHAVQEQHVAEGDIERFYEDSNVRIIIPKTEGASCKYGAGTKWCTAATKGTNMFENYSKHGPLYILIPKKPEFDGEKYQVHLATAQYMDPKDEPVKWSKLRKRFPNITKIPEFKQADFFDAIKRGDIEEVTVLLKDPNVDPSANNNKAINAVSSKGHKEIVKLLLNDERVDPSGKNNRAISDASKNGHIEIVQLLLNDKRVDPSADNNIAFRSAESYGHKGIVELLRSDPRVKFIMDMDAIEHPEQFLELLKNTTYLTSGTNLAIRLASQRGYADAVKYLLTDSAVDPSAMENEAIRYAADFGHSDVVKLLLEDSRIDPMAKTNRGTSALFVAIENNNISVVNLLLSDPRVDPSAADNSAIRRASYPDMVKALLADDRVDPTAGDNKAIREANKKGHTNVVELLKSWYQEHGIQLPTDLLAEKKKALLGEIKRIEKELKLLHKSKATHERKLATTNAEIDQKEILLTSKKDELYS